MTETRAFRLLGVAALLAAFLLSGCSGETAPPEADFGLLDTAGVTRTVRTEKIEDGNTIGLASSARVTVFRVEGGFRVDASGDTLTLALKDGGGARIGVLNNDEETRLLRTIPTEMHDLLVIEIPLAADERFDGFFILHADRDQEPRISSAAVTERSAYFEYDGAAAFLGADIELQQFDWSERQHARLQIAEPERALPADQTWSISVRFGPLESGNAGHSAATATDGRAYTSGQVRFSSGRHSHRMKLVLTPGNRELHFGGGIIGFVPDTIEIDIEPGMAIERVAVKRDGRIGIDTSYPAIPADLGVINFYNQRAWRHPRFELFSWNVADNVLIFDFADLDIQRDMFGRLGFFVAVAGEAGQIFSEEYYEGRHTYNAHDYRPQDLVPFFTIAEQTGVGLNRREEFLRDVLIDYGIIHRDGDGYREGHGAVLSFSRATWRPLRRRLLRHEAMHGIFYVSERFRAGSFDLWERMSPPEQEYWRLFLGNKGRMDGREGYDGYDVDRLYLLVNEMQAHVLQLHPHEVNPYFRDFYARRIREVAPESAHIVNDLIAAEPDVFVNTRRALEQLLEQATGVGGGYLMAVYPENTEILHD